MEGSAGGSCETEIAKTDACSGHGGSTVVGDGGGGGGDGAGAAVSASADGKYREGAALLSDDVCDQRTATGSPSSLPVDIRNGAVKPEKLARHAESAVAPVASTSFKKSGGSGNSGRRAAQKRVVTVRIADIGEGSRPRTGTTAGTGDAAPPPSDSWTWRKYGQKPIKGSPYPRGYYRCSSSKGCPARKQVERSHADPTMLIVTYASEHNHPWPLPRNSTHHGSSRQSAAAAAAGQQAAALGQAGDPLLLITAAGKLPQALSSSTDEEEDMEVEYENAAVDEEQEVKEKVRPVNLEPDTRGRVAPSCTTETTTSFTNHASTSSPSEETTFSAEHSLSGASDDAGTLMPPLGVDDLCSSTWFPAVDSEISLICSTTADSAAKMMLPFSYDDIRIDLQLGGGEVRDDEDSLFAGLGELPEFSLVCRRQMLFEQLAADFSR